MKMNLARKGLTPFSDLTSKAGTDGDGLQLLGCTKT